MSIADAINSTKEGHLMAVGLIDVNNAGIHILQDCRGENVNIAIRGTAINSQTVRV